MRRYWNIFQWNRDGMESHAQWWPDQARTESVSRHGKCTSLHHSTSASSQVIWFHHQPQHGVTKLTQDNGVFSQNLQTLIDFDPSEMEIYSAEWIKSPEWLGQLPVIKLGQRQFVVCFEGYSVTLSWAVLSCGCLCVLWTLLQVGDVRRCWVKSISEIN